MEYGSSGLFIDDDSCTLGSYKDDVTQCNCTLSSIDMHKVQVRRRLVENEVSGMSFILAAMPVDEAHKAVIVKEVLTPSSISFDVVFDLAIDANTLDPAAVKSLKETLAAIMEISVDDIFKVEFIDSSTSSSISSSQTQASLDFGLRSKMELLLAKTFSVKITITLSSTNYNNVYVNNMNDVVSQKTTALSHSFSDGNFISKYSDKARVNAAPNISEVSGLTILIAAQWAPTLAPTVQPTTNPAPTTDPDKKPKSEPKMMPATMTGVYAAIGVIIGLLLCGGIYFLYKRWPSNKYSKVGFTA